MLLVAISVHSLVYYHYVLLNEQGTHIALTIALPGGALGGIDGVIYIINVSNAIFTLIAGLVEAVSALLFIIMLLILFKKVD
jgi:hypothetical protein